MRRTGLRNAALIPDSDTAFTLLMRASTTFPAVSCAPQPSVHVSSSYRALGAVSFDRNIISAIETMSLEDARKRSFLLASNALENRRP